MPRRPAEAASRLVAALDKRLAYVFASGDTQRPARERIGACRDLVAGPMGEAIDVCHGPHFNRSFCESPHKSADRTAIVSFVQGWTSILRRMNLSHTTTPRKASPPTAAGGINFARAAGFTMVEMLMTMAIAIILLTIGVPSFRYVTNSNRIAGELNGLLGDLQFARAEAIKEGSNVTVCVSSNGTSCSNSTAWQNGWIVYTNSTNTVWRVQSPFTSSDTFAASNNVSAVTFNRDGYAVGIANGTLITLHDSTDTSAWTRCLSIGLSGAMTSEQAGTTNNGATCT